MCKYPPIFCERRSGHERPYARSLSANGLLLRWIGKRLMCLVVICLFAAICAYTAVWFYEVHCHSVFDAQPCLASSLRATHSYCILFLRLWCIRSRERRNREVSELAPPTAPERGALAMRFRQATAWLCCRIRSSQAAGWVRFGLGGRPVHNPTARASQ